MAALTPPPVSTPSPTLPLQRATAPATPAAESASESASAPVVQRFPGRHATGALASFAAATAGSALRHLQERSSQHTPPPDGPPPGSPPPYSATPAPRPAGDTVPPPAYTPVPDGGLDPRKLTEFQLDELAHRLIGRVTRLVRTELRMDRERIGRLRDPRN